MEFWGFKMLILLKFYLFISRLLDFLFYVSSSHSNSENHLDCNFQNFYESMTNMMRICKIVIHVKIWGFRYVLTYSQTGINSSNWVQQFTQPANIGPQDVPRTFPSNVPRPSPKDPIWPSRGRTELTSQGRLKMTSWGRPNLTSKGRLRKVDSGRLEDVLRTPPRRSWKHVGTMWVHVRDLGTMWFICWMSLNFSLLFFRNLFDWPNLSESNKILKVYLETSWTSKMELLLQSQLMTFSR